MANREFSTATRIVRSSGRSVQSMTADIRVVGAGIAGMSAALEAAQLGRRVVLADALTALRRRIAANVDQ